MNFRVVWLKKWREMSARNYFSGRRNHIKGILFFAIKATYRKNITHSQKMYHRWNKGNFFSCAFILCGCNLGEKECVRIRTKKVTQLYFTYLSLFQCYIKCWHICLNVNNTIYFMRLLPLHLIPEFHLFQQQFDIFFI